LLAIASQALQTGVDEKKSLPASSSLIFEIWADNTVHGYLNDVEFSPVGCPEDVPCTTDYFVDGLTARIGQTDPAAYCNAEPTPEEPFIQA